MKEKSRKNEGEIHSELSTARFSTIGIGHSHLQFYPEVDTAKVLATAYKSIVQA